MKAIVVEHLGQPGALMEREEPVPGAREVAVKIAVAGVNPVDWKIRDVYGRSMPYTLGQDFAGVVVSVGSDVREYAYGDRVFGIARANGAYAEMTLMPVDDPDQPMAKIPQAVGDADAAGLPTPGLTALACVERLPSRSGLRVLIIGITGGVGQIAAQLAIAQGCEVSGIGSRSQEENLRALGVSNYFSRNGIEGPDVLEMIERDPAQRFDVVLDLVNSEEHLSRSTHLLNSGGLLISTNHAVGEHAFAGSSFEAVNVNLPDTSETSHNGLRHLAKMLQQGELHVPIVGERSLQDAVQALDLVKSGGLSGKMLVTMS